MHSDTNITRLRVFAFALTMLGQGSLTLCIPSFPILASYFHVGAAIVKFSLTLFLLAYGVSQLLYGPLSDVYGRRKILIFGLLIMLFGSAATPLAHNFLFFNIARILQGFGAGATMVLIRASLRDVTSGSEYSKSMSFLSMGFAIGLGLFPLFGAFLTHWLSWHAVFVFLLVVVCLMLLAVINFYPETLSSDVGFNFTDTIQKYGKVVGSSIFWFFFGGGMCAYSIVLIYNVMTPFLVQQGMGWSAQAYGFLFIAIAFPYWLGSFCNSRMVTRFLPKIMVQAGLILIISAAAIMLFAAKLSSYLNIYVLILPFMIAVFGQSLIWSNAMALALNSFAQFSGVASSLFSCLQLLMSALINFVVIMIPDSSPVPVALCLGVFGILAIIFFITAFAANKAKYITM